MVMDYSVLQRTNLLLVTVHNPFIGIPAGSSSSGQLLG